MTTAKSHFEGNMAPLRSFALAFIAYHCCEGARWSSGSPKNGAMLYTCNGGTATLSWNIDLTTGDVIQDIKWFLEDISMVRETIATSSRGSFFPVPGYDTRLKFLTNAGLQLDHVTTGDAGNYSVEIIGRDGFGAQFTMRRSVHVEVFRKKKPSRT
ncbi:uncharacterized protein [Littorina saxatilis]|uniref:uncharacterized protein n=1 Tax=Littorina saxatilis TaxID=31220 RepID=UPI0038B67386